MSSSEERNARHEKILGLLREEFQEIDGELKEAEAKLTDLRDRRRQSLAALRHFAPDDPTVQAAIKSRPGPKMAANGRHGLAGISVEKTDEILAWIRDHEDEFPDGFYASGLAEHPDFDLVSKSTLQRAIPLLADQGKLRLDHKGSSRADGMGGRLAKFYKLTPDATA